VRRKDKPEEQTDTKHTAQLFPHPAVAVQRGAASTDTTLADWRCVKFLLQMIDPGVAGWQAAEQGADLR
jgi:hypothetical protein